MREKLSAPLYMYHNRNIDFVSFGGAISFQTEGARRKKKEKKRQVRFGEEVMGSIPFVWIGGKRTARARVRLGITFAAHACMKIYSIDTLLIRKMFAIIPPSPSHFCLVSH